MTFEETPAAVEQLLATEGLSHVLGGDRFKQFLDFMPIAVAVSALSLPERIIYANGEFAHLTGQADGEIVGHSWSHLPGIAALPELRPMGEIVSAERDYIGAFAMPRGETSVTVDAWSNVIDDEQGAPAFRLVALAEPGPREPTILDEIEEQIREKDIQLRELQHRVKNNLQMITALIRVEAKGVTDRTTSEGFDRLAGRVEALGLLYRVLTESGLDDKVDLGVYLSDIASAVIRAHAMEGIHLDLQVDTWPVALDVAMPTGLVVNELLTNALKHAFDGRAGGTITLHCRCEGAGCRILVADDGGGLPEDAAWPKPGKLSSLIVRSLLQNANASLDVTSTPGQGTRVEIVFTSAEVSPG